MENPAEFYFHAGENQRTGQGLMLKQGEVSSLVNAEMKKLGIVRPRKTFQTTKVVTGTIDSMQAAPDGSLWVGANGTVYQYTPARGWDLVMSSLESAKIRVASFGGWAHLANGTDLERFLISDPANEQFTWGVTNPTTAPTISPTGSDTACYYSLVLKYSDGSEYETDLSLPGYTDRKQTVTMTQSDVTFQAASRTITRATGSWIADGFQSADDLSITVSGSQYNDGTYDIDTITPTTITIQTAYTLTEEVAGASVTVNSEAYNTLTWTIPVSTTTGVTHKRLYRVYGGLTYQVAEIANETSSYTDTVSDTDLGLSPIFERADYYPPPGGIWNLVEHYSRIMAVVNGSYSHCLFWSEAFEPQAFLYDADAAEYSNMTTVFAKGDAITGIATLGSDLYLASHSTFKRLVGSSPSYWVLRPTSSEVGNVAPYSMLSTPFGILHVYWDGVYLFNGYSSTNITKQCADFFAAINWEHASDIDAVFDGTQYRLFVPYGESTVPSRTLVIDFDLYPGTIRCWEETGSELCAAFNRRNGQLLYGVGVNIGERGGDDPVAFELTSRTIPTAGLLKLDAPTEFHYEIDTGEEDVTVTLYYDHIPHATTLTLNTTTRTRAHTTIPFVDARVFHFKLSGTVSNKVAIYEPWLIK